MSIWYDSCGSGGGRAGRRELQGRSQSIKQHYAHHFTAHRLPPPPPPQSQFCPACVRPLCMCVLRVCVSLPPPTHREEVPYTHRMHAIMMVSHNMELSMGQQTFQQVVLCV